MVNMTSHKKRCWGHDKIQHLSRQKRHKSVLPLKRVKVQHEAFSNKCQQSPVRGEENYPLFSQNTSHNLEENQNATCLQRAASRNAQIVYLLALWVLVFLIVIYIYIIYIFINWSNIHIRILTKLRRGQKKRENLSDSGNQ